MAHEHKVFFIEPGPDMAHATGCLNELSADGWELVSAIPTLATNKLLPHQPQQMLLCVLRRPVGAGVLQPSELGVLKD